MGSTDTRFGFLLTSALGFKARGFFACFLAELETIGFSFFGCESKFLNFQYQLDLELNYFSNSTE